MKNRLFEDSFHQNSHYPSHPWWRREKRGVSRAKYLLSRSTAAALHRRQKIQVDVGDGRASERATAFTPFARTKTKRFENALGFFCAVSNGLVANCQCQDATARRRFPFLALLFCRRKTIGRFRPSSALRPLAPPALSSREMLLAHLSYLTMRLASYVMGIPTMAA